MPDIVQYINRLQTLLDIGGFLVRRSKAEKVEPAVELLEALNQRALVNS